VEESRANIQIYSTDFAAQWTFGGPGTGVLYPNVALAPDNTFTASKLAAENFRYLKGSNNGLNLASGYVAFNLATGSFVESLGTVTSYGIVAVGNGWYRVHLVTGGYCASVYAKAAELSQIGIQLFGNGFYIYSKDAPANNTTNGILIWGAQTEAGAFPTSYIPTTSSTVTRSADVASMTGTNFSSWYNQSEGTWVAGLPIPAKQSNSRVFTGGTEIWADPTPRITAVRTGSSTNYISVTHPVIAAAAYNSSTCFGAAGGLLSANVGGTLTTPTQMIIGRSTAAGVGYINVPISRLTYYPTRLPDATLQALTL